MFKKFDFEMVMFIHQISFHSPYHQLFNFRFQFEKSVNSVWIHIYVLKAKCKCAMQQKERFLGTGWRVESGKTQSSFGWNIFP